MANAGLIYILINPSLNGLLKIGKTTRSAEERAKELSDATGVPTPFIVAFEEAFDDCDLAENYIHELLQQKGYRVSDSREFFSIPLKEGVRLLLEVKSKILLNNTQPLNSQIDSSVDKAEGERPVWENLDKQALGYLIGDDNTIQDYRRALKLFKQSAIMGSAEAGVYLAFMSSQGLGCKASHDKAIDYSNEAIRLGGPRYYPSLARLYHNNAEYENAEKCWRRYFNFLLTESGDQKAVEANIKDYIERLIHDFRSISTAAPSIEYISQILKIDFSKTLKQIEIFREKYRALRNRPKNEELFNAWLSDIFTTWKTSISNENMSSEVH